MIAGVLENLIHQVLSRWCKKKKKLPFKMCRLSIRKDERLQIKRKTPRGPDATRSEEKPTASTVYTCKYRLNPHGMRMHNIIKAVQRITAIRWNKGREHRLQALRAQSAGRQVIRQRVSHGLGFFSNYFWTSLERSTVVAVQWDCKIPILLKALSRRRSLLRKITALMGNAFHTGRSCGSGFCHRFSFHKR